MSSETSAWAKEQRCGDPVTKAVLMEIANWAKPTGICEFLSVRRIADVVEVSTRTVQRHIARLEDADTAGGLCMIRRIERHREDGGQWANAFELVGYQPPQSAAQTRTRPPRDRLSPPHDKMTQGDDSDVTGGMTLVSPDREKNILPPSTDKSVEPPPEPDADREDRFSRPHALPEDWEPPTIADLQPEARELVTGWPEGAYPVMCANFRNYWRDPGTKNRRKADWRAALCNWLIRVHAEVKRAEKAGVSYAVAAPRVAQTAPPPRPVTARRREDGAARAIHARLNAGLGEAVYRQWLAPCAILPNRPGLVLIAPTRFCADWIEQNHAALINQAATITLGARPAWLRFEVEQRAVSGKEAGQYG